MQTAPVDGILRAHDQDGGRSVRFRCRQNAAGEMTDGDHGALRDAAEVIRFAVLNGEDHVGLSECARFLGTRKGNPAAAPASGDLAVAIRETVVRVDDLEHGVRDVAQDGRKEGIFDDNDIEFAERAEIPCIVLPCRSHQAQVRPLPGCIRTGQAVREVPVTNQ